MSEDLKGEQEKVDHPVDVNLNLSPRHDRVLELLRTAMSVRAYEGDLQLLVCNIRGRAYVDLELWRKDPVRCANLVLEDFRAGIISACDELWGKLNTEEHE